MIISNSITNGKTKKSFESLEKRFNDVHGDKYDYSKVVYRGNKKDVIIVCKEHGDFLQRPNNHKNGQGCPRCGYNKLSKMKTHTTVDFLSAATRVHGSKYDYSKVSYVGSHKKITILCNKHKINFKQYPYSHLAGQGCPVCGEVGRIRAMLSNKDSMFRIYYGEMLGVWKIGVTSNTINRRMSQERGDFKLIFMSSEIPLDVAVDIEQRIIRKFSRYKSNKKNILNGSHSSLEIFDINILREPEKTINRMIENI